MQGADMISFILDKFTELAAQPIFSSTKWEKVPTSYNRSQRLLVTADIFCEKCKKEKTFSGKAFSKWELSMEYQKASVPQYAGFGTTPFDFINEQGDSDIEEMISEMAFPTEDAITVQLKCPTCGSLVYICYIVEIHEAQQKAHNVSDKSERESNKYRVHKIGEYPNQEISRLQSLSKYIVRFPKEYQLLSKAERAYRDTLGTGAIVYIRKAYENLLYGILDENSIERPNNFSELLKCADDVAHIVPTILTDRAYGLFGEISDIVHGDIEDALGLDKFENLRDMFLLILDTVIEKEHYAEVAEKIKTDSEAKDRRKRVKGGTDK